jgi:hypothetical protein
MSARLVPTTSLASWRVEALVPLTANRRAAAPKASFTTTGTATSVRYPAMAFSGLSQGIRSDAPDAAAHDVPESVNRNTVAAATHNTLSAVRFMGEPISKMSTPECMYAD